MWWKELKTPLFTVLFVFLGLLIFTKLFGPIPFYVNNVTTNKASMFTVQGTGEATAVPDTALLYFGVEKKATTVEAAKNEVNKIINQLTKDLKALGVKEKDIKTTNFSVTSPYPYYTTDVPQEDVLMEPEAVESAPAAKSDVRIMPLPPVKPTGKLYSVSANIEVRVSPIETANKAVDAATAAGANQVGGVQFVVNDQKQKELEQQARKEAIKNAKEKAQDIADAAGIKLGKVIDVQESFGGYPMAYARGADMLMKTQEASETPPPTELNPGESKISISVSLSYETR